MKKKSLIKAFRRVAAGILAGAMILTGAPLGSITAQAAVLPPNGALNPGSPTTPPGDGDYSKIDVVKVGNYTFGNSNSTAYAFGAVTNSTNGGATGNSFNVGAITDAASAKNNTKGYLSSTFGGTGLGAATVTSGFGSNWWNTWYAYGTDAQVTPNVTTWASDGITPTAASNPTVPRNIFSPIANGVVTEINTPGGTGKVEVRMEVKPTDDKQNILLQYTVYNNSTENVDFWIGNESDTQIYNTDGCHVIINEGQTHLHMMDILAGHGLKGRGAEGSADNNPYGLADFDVRLSDHTNSENRVWIGQYSDTAGVTHPAWVFAKNKKDNLFIQGIDSAASWSSRFHLGAHAMQTSSFTISMRTAVYYVDPNYTGTDSCGYITLPYKSVKAAIDAMGNKGVKKGYIYLVNDDTVNDTITIPAGLDVQIASSPYKDLSGLDITTGGTLASKNYIDLDAQSIDPTSTAIHSMKRGAGLADKAMFKVNKGGANLQLSNVTIDGSSVEATSPLIEVDSTATGAEAGAGNVVMHAGTTVQNAKTSGNVAGVASINGDGTLRLNGIGGEVKIENNVSGTSSAIVIADSIPNTKHPVSINGDVQINVNNKNAAGNAANVNIGKTSLWVAKGDTFTGKIGVNTKNMPDVDGRATPIVDFEERATGGVVPYSTANFVPDAAGVTINNADVSNQVTGGGLSQSPGVIYLNSPFRSITISYVDADGNTIGVNPTGGTDPNKFAPGTVNPVTISASVGSEIKFGSPTPTAPVVAPALAGHVISEVTFSPAGADSAVTGGTIVKNHGSTLGNISGTVFNADTDITVKYVRSGKTYKFDTQGGTPIADKYEPITGAAASTLGAPPHAVRTGYNFVKWVEYTDSNNDNIFNAGDTSGADFTDYRAPSGSPETIKVYALWAPGSTTYEVRRNYANSNPSLTLSLGSDASNYIITSVVDHDPAVIPGYKYVSGTKTPSSIGTLDTNAAPTPNAGHFHIDSMPAQAVAVNYKYVVDTTQTFNFTVKHVDAGNHDIGSAPPVSARRAEQAINAQKQNITGYTYDHMTIDAGWNSNLGSYIVGLDNPVLVTTNDSTNGSFAGFMPNQDVTITFHYTADAGMNLVRKYLDAEMGNRLVYSKVDGPMTPGQSVNFPFTSMDELYGYVYGTSNVEDLDPAHTATVAVDGSGNITGNMSATGNGVRVNFMLNHDASKWRAINFAVANAPYEKGSINPLPAGAPTSFLANDGSAAGNTYAYSFNKLTAEGYIPSLTPNRYYMFEGWYLDAAATHPVNAADTFPTGTTPLTLYAKFVEDPNQWYDISFASGTNGSISAPASLHIPYDYTWGQIATQIPTATPVVNYNFTGWRDPAGTLMGSGSPLTNHATYTANFGKDAPTWGTNVGAINPSGRIGSDGSGEIVIEGTTPGNIYVISDPSGNIIAVVPGSGTGSVTTVPDLIPGAHYNVQEGTPDTQATVGNNIGSITGTAISPPQDVYIPTVDNNYNIGYDPHNDGQAQIIVNPADPDADYALIDENGNVVNYPGSDNGWMTPVGSGPATVTFDNLNPNETYTVVARKKGNSGIPDPLMKLPDGNQIIANPGDMAEAQKYVVETISGDIVSVGDTSVGSNSYSEAKAGDTVVIHAEPVNSNGKNFLYWSVLAGRAVGVTGKITSADYTFTLSNSNIVLKAVYEPTPIAGDDAGLTETIRGGDTGEFGLDPNLIPGLAHDLTTPLDRSLIGVNGASVDYKVVFNKRDAKPAEKNAVKPLSESGTHHEDAFTAAYGLDILLERYVDGRKVDRATSSNATVDVIAQLPAADVDQLDYQLFDVTPDSTGAINPIEVTITTDVANNAGLLKFTGNLTHSYVLVYSKTFKVTFVDNKPVLDHLFLNDTSRNFYHRFKVRRKESVEDSYYNSDYAIVTDYAQNDVAHNLTTPFEDIYGVQYDYVNWSKKEDSLSVYDTSSGVTRKTVVYAYYKNNRPEVLGARDELGDVIEEAKLLTTDPYLKVGEVAEINEAIAKAVETLRQARDLVSPDGTTYLRQANYEELQQQIDALRELIRKYMEIANQRKDARNRRTGGASGGGNSSSGRGSKLLTPGEKSLQTSALMEGSNTRAFVLGVDGSWETNPVTGGWSFVLNGGTPLNDMWGMISFNDNTGKKVSRWYYFDGQSTMATGWVYDSKNGRWYYMNTTEGPELGQMVTGWVKDPQSGKWYYMNDNTGILKTGWHLDPQDNRWYYLNTDGAMLIGWNMIDGKWYYFSTYAPTDTYTWDAAAFKWNYNGSQRPYGSMYAGEKTPDGYTVDASGAWN